MWLYKEKEFIDPLHYYGFVYIITNLLTNKKYIGRKFFTSAGYKTIAGKRKKIRKSSGWENYWGSSKALLADIEILGSENFKREIILLCTNRSSCSYYESKKILETDAILKDEYYNDWVSMKVTSAHVKAIARGTI